MPHIHTAPGQHDHTVSAYIIRTDFDEPKIMLHCHKIFKKWLQFGGHVELHETPWEAICHEIPEETGYEMSQLKIMQPHDRITKMGTTTIHPIPVVHFTHPFPDIKHSHTDKGFLFVTDQPPKNKIGKGESQEMGLFTLAEIAKHPNLITGVEDIMQFIVDVALPNWEALPTSTFK